jgi:signal transduction histidine kinase
MKFLNYLQRSPIVFPLACVAMLAMVFISEGSYMQSVRQLDDVGEMATARVAIQRLTRSIVDAETGQRGYLLTGKNEYLQPYAAALKDIDVAFNLLDAHYQDEAQAKGMVVLLHNLTESKLSELAITVRLYDDGKTDASKEIILSGSGKEKMDAIRVLAAQLLDHESSKVAQGRLSIYRTLMISRLGIAALSALSLLALFLYLRQLAAHDRHQLELARMVQAERDRLEVQVRQRTEQLTELTQHLETAREDERSRLARDLHDELGAMLTSAKLDAARIKSRLGTTAPEAMERLNHLVEALNGGIALKRRIVEDLRPSALSNLGLVTTLEILAREFAERAEVQVHCELAPVKLKPSTELVVYRLIQESITNISKYAAATQVWVKLTSSHGQVYVSVRDNGVGFDATQKPKSAYGLVGMRFRVEAEGGVLNVVSAPGCGTDIQATLPEANLDELLPA